MTTTPDPTDPQTARDSAGTVPPRATPPAEQPTTPLPGAVPAGAVPSGSVPPGSVPSGSAQAPTGAPAQGYPQGPHGAYPEAQAPAYSQPNAFGAPAPQPGQAGGVGGPGQPGHGAAPQRPQESPQPKSRTGALVAGLAIGALLGGVVGGGVAAVVSANSSSHATAQGAGGSVTIKNPENATAISAVAAVATPSVVTLEVAGANASGSGSGVIYRKDGYIVTNAHVVTLDGAAQDATIRVKLSDGRILDGDVVGIDPYADIAVVKIDADDLPAVEVADSDQLDVGDLTVAIGAPLNLASTVTSGVVSALNRGISVGSPLIPQDPSQDQGDQDDEGGGDQGDQGDNGFGFPWDFRFGLPDQQQQQQPEQQQSSGGTVTLPVIQTDASINPGNSGGALLNGEGQLIGINVAIASAVTGQDGTAGSNGLGFAIPASLVSRVADSIIDGEQPSHGLLGASVADSSQDTDDDANHAGGLIIDVAKGGAADQAGLKVGDVITAVDGVPAVDGTSVSALIRVHEGGSKISIDYTRGGKAGQTEATLGKLEW